MNKLAKVAVSVMIAALATGWHCEVSGKATPSKLKTASLAAKDLATADGSCRVGLHNGKIYGVLTGISTDIELSPDVWTGDEESKKWNTWLVDFDNAIYTQWMNANAGDAQETVAARIGDGAITVQARGQFMPAPGNNDPDAQVKFEAAIKTALEQAYKSLGPMPATKNPLKEVRMALTFLRDPRLVPRFLKQDFGFAATLTPAGDNLVVDARQKEGRVPGIQIISDSEGGSIKVTDPEPFLRKCAEIDARGL